MPKPTFLNLPEEKRKRILSVAMDEFATYPYSKASLSNIVTRAGIAKGSMYQYFEGKRDLYTYILDLAAGEKMAYMKQEINPEADFFTALGLFMMAGTRFNLEHAQLGRIIANAMDSAEEELFHDLFVKGKQMAIDFFEQMLQKGREKGEIRRDIDSRLVANMMYSLAGQGLAEYLLESLGVTMHQYLADPHISQRMTLERTEQVITEVMKFLRHGLQKGANNNG